MLGQDPSTLVVCEAVQQTCAAGGPDAACRIVTCVGEMPIKIPLCRDIMHTLLCSGPFDLGRVLIKPGSRANVGRVAVRGMRDKSDYNPSGRRRSLDQ